MLTLFRPRGGWILPPRTLNVYNVFSKQAKATKLGDFSCTLSGNNLVWKVLAHQLWRYHGNHSLARVFYIFRSFSCYLLVLITFWSILVHFEGSGRWQIQRWPPLENITLFWRQMTSSADVADLKGNVFWTYYLSFKFRRHSFNILRVKKGPAVPEDQKSPV